MTPLNTYRSQTSPNRVYTLGQLVEALFNVSKDADEVAATANYMIESRHVKILKRK